MHMGSGRSHGIERMVCVGYTRGDGDKSIARGWMERGRARGKLGRGVLAQDGGALLLARATDTPSSSRGDGSAWVLAATQATDATYFVACFICAIRRCLIRLSYLLEER